MFFKILSNFKDERKVIIALAVVVILIISFIKMINNNVKNQNYNSSSSINTTTAINANIEKNIIATINNNIIDFIDNNQSLNNKQDSLVSNTTSEEAIKSFINYCNNKQITNAYSMLTDECKLLMYKTENEFYKNYYMKIFNNAQKKISYQRNKYNSNIFKITYFDDLLATGGVENSNNFVDSITTIYINGTYKINISNFIEKQVLDVKGSNSYLDITIVDKTIYTDNETYTIKVKNNTKVDMILSELINKSDIYIQDKNGNKFYIANSEYIKEDITISPNNESTINLKINKNYDNNNAQKLVFSKIKLINKLYYDSNTTIENELTGEVSYEQKYTAYTPEFGFEIDLQ